MVKCRTRLIKEKAQESKTYKKEMKLWKKEIGQERRKYIKLERKLAHVSEEQSIVTGIGSQAPSTNSKNSLSKILDKETLCSICADPIPDYIPKCFEDIQINPACTNFDDENESNIGDPTATENQESIIHAHLPTSDHL